MAVQDHDPGRDAAERHPSIVIRHRSLGGVPAVVSVSRGVILIEREMPRAERRCALAHEVAHLDLGHRLPACEGREERKADELAASRLLPLARLAEVLRWALSPGEVADELGVTAHMVRVRVKALTDHEKLWIEQQMARLEEIA